MTKKQNSIKRVTGHDIERRAALAMLQAGLANLSELAQTRRRKAKSTTPHCRPQFIRYWVTSAITIPVAGSTNNRRLLITM